MAIEPASADGRELTVDELARAGDLPVSTVRLYQNRGLLDPPTKRGRVGYYGPAHLERLRLISRLQDRGFSLAAIKDLVTSMESGESLRSALGLGDTPSTWSTEPAETIPFAELAGQLPQVEFTPHTVQRIMELGLVEFSDEDPGDVVIRTPSFLRIGGELASLGVPPDVILDEYVELRADAARIAQRFTDVFVEHLWEPFASDDLTPERTSELIGSLERLGPLAEAVVVVSLRQALQALADQFIQAEAARLGLDIPAPGAGTTGQTEA